MTNTETDRVKRLRDLAEHWHGHEASGFFAGCAAEIERLQLRESQARAILEPLAEHDPAIRQWLKGLPVDTQVERLRALLIEVQNDAGNWLANELQGRIAAEVGPGGTSPAGYPAEPSREYHKWPGEPPHCMSCSCGMTEEQKALAARSVPLEDYLRVHGELMELKYPGSTPSEKSSAPPNAKCMHPGCVLDAAHEGVHCYPNQPLRTSGEPT